MEHKPSILYWSFNPDSTFLALGLQTSFCVLGCEHFELLYSSSTQPASIETFGASIVEQCSVADVVAVVPAPSCGEFSSNQLFMWSTVNNISSAELSFEFDIEGVRLSPTR